MTALSRLDHRFWLVGIVALGVGLRLYRLGDQSLWADEGISYWIASAGDVGEVMQRQGRSSHPPLGFLIDHLALQIRDSDTFLRLPSALLGGLTIPLIYALGRKLAWPTAALLATVIFAVSPFHLWHSQDARAYAPLLLVNTASTLALLWTIETGRSRSGGAAYAIAAALGVYLHAFAIFAIAVHGVWLLTCRPRWLPWFIVVVGAAVLVSLPITQEWAAYVLRRLFAPAGEVAIGVTDSPGRAAVSIAFFPYALYAFAVGYSFGPDLSGLHADRSLAFLARFWPQIVLVALTFGSLLVAGIVALLRRSTLPGLALVVLGLLMPLLADVAISIVTRVPANVRYVIAAYPYFCILLGAGMAWLVGRRPVVGWSVSCLVVVLSLWSWSNYLDDPRFAKEDLRAAVRAWQAAGAAGTLFSLSPAGGVREVVDRYLLPEERPRHIPVAGGEVSSLIASIMADDGDRAAHVIIARDWNHQLEQAVAAAFEVRESSAFSGVRLLEIVREDDS